MTSSPLAHVLLGDGPMPKLMLMLATSILARPPSRCDVTQSIPHTSHETKPLPLWSSTLTDHRRTPGATPTTPMLLSRAPTMPATCVPWPLPSSHLLRFDDVQLYPPTTFRSG